MTDLANSEAPQDRHGDAHNLADKGLDPYYTWHLNTVEVTFHLWDPTASSYWLLEPKTELEGKEDFLNEVCKSHGKLKD